MNIVVNYGINISKSSNKYRMNYRMDIVVNYQMHNLIYQTIFVKLSKTYGIIYQMLKRIKDMWHKIELMEVLFSICMKY